MDVVRLILTLILVAIPCFAVLVAVIQIILKLAARKNKVRPGEPHPPAGSPPPGQDPGA